VLNDVKGLATTDNSLVSRLTDQEETTNDFANICSWTKSRAPEKRAISLGTEMEVLQECAFRPCFSQGKENYNICCPGYYFAFVPSLCCLLCFSSNTRPIVHGK
jgi:hypothetical protein